MAAMKVEEGARLGSRMEQRQQQEPKQRLCRTLNWPHDRFVLYKHARLLISLCISFPGIKPVAMSRRDMSSLLSHNYLVYEPIADARRLLFYYISDKTRNTLYLIDEDWSVRYIDVCLPQIGAAPLKDTLLDCVLTMRPGGDAGEPVPTFIVTDVMMMDGVVLTHKPLTSRLGVRQVDYMGLC